MSQSSVCEKEKLSLESQLLLFSKQFKRVTSSTNSKVKGNP